MTTMCFDVISKMKVADKNITCYKFVRGNGESIHYGLRITNKNGTVKREKWNEGYIYSETNFPESRVSGSSIDGGGFHSFREISNIRGILSCKIVCYRI